MFDAGDALMGDFVGRAADDGGIGGNIADDDGTGADDGVAADDESWQHGGTDPDQGAITDGHVAADVNAGGDMDVVAEFAIVIDGSEGSVVPR